MDVIGSTLPRLRPVHTSSVLDHDHPVGDSGPWTVEWCGVVWYGVHCEGKEASVDRWISQDPTTFVAPLSSNPLCEANPRERAILSLRPLPLSSPSSYIDPSLFVLVD